MAMKKPKSGEAYVAEHPHWSKELGTLRQLLLDTELEEKIKWGIPVYCLDNKNVIGLAGFKHKYGLWFYQGSFLSDSAKILVNAQEGKTKGMRHIYFQDGEAIDKKLLRKYIAESIANEKAGKKIKVTKRKLLIGALLATALKEDSQLYEAYELLRESQKVDYAEHINEAKQQATKERRLKKIIPMIKDGKGLNDKYKSNSKNQPIDYSPL